MGAVEPLGVGLAAAALVVLPVSPEHGLALLRLLLQPVSLASPTNAAITAMRSPSALTAATAITAMTAVTAPPPAPSSAIAQQLAPTPELCPRC